MDAFEQLKLAHVELLSCVDVARWLYQIRLCGRGFNSVIHPSETCLRRVFLLGSRHNGAPSINSRTTWHGNFTPHPQSEILPYATGFSYVLECRHHASQFEATLIPAVHLNEVWPAAAGDSEIEANVGEMRQNPGKVPGDSQCCLRKHSLCT